MHFPRDEYDGRIAAARAAMSRQKIDLLLLFGQEAVCWLSGFYTPAYFAYTALGLPLTGEPFLVLRRMEEPAARETSWVADQRVYNDDQDPTEIARTAVLSRVSGRARIALDTHSWYLTVDRYRALSAALPDASLVSDERLIDRLRVVKSARELEMLRAAARIVEAGLQGAIDASVPGATERDVAAAMASARLRAGSDLPVDGVLTTGERTLQGHGPWTDRVLRDGDPLYYEFHGIKNHYWARMLRSGVLGEPTREQQRVYDVLVQAQDAAIGEMRPGCHSQSIDRLCREPLIEAGWKSRTDYVNRVGYGLGLNFRPTPGEFILEFTPGSDFVLERGMVFHMILTAQGLGISDTLVIADHGVELLTRFPRKLFVPPRRR